MVPFKDPKDFASRAVFQPLHSCVQCALEFAEHSDADVLDINVRNLAKVLLVLEELMAFHADFSMKRESIVVNQTLEGLGLDVAWLDAYICDLLLILSQDGAFCAIALFTLKILVLDAANVTRGKKRGSPGRGTVGGRDTTIASKLVMRVVKFLQASVSCLAALPRSGPLHWSDASEVPPFPPSFPLSCFVYSLYLFIHIKSDSSRMCSQ